MKSADAALGRIRGQTRTVTVSSSLRPLGSVAVAPSGPCKRRAWIESFVFLAVGEIWRHVTSVMKYKTLSRGNQSARGVDVRETRTQVPNDHDLGEGARGWLILLLTCRRSLPCFSAEEGALEV